MKKFLKYTAYVVIAVVVIAIAGVSYITLALPNVGNAEDIKIALTPQRIERGKYLANHVTLCMDCHSTRDWTKFAGPMLEGSDGRGGEKFTSAVGFPGNVEVPNITPYHLGNWTDGELLRAITTGVKKDGSAIFPLMPWPYYSKMDREDLYSIIAYVRSLKSIKADYPKSTLDFPLNILVHTMPQKASLGKAPDASDTLKYGGYLVTSAACMECHSQVDKGKIIPGLEYAGGREFVIPNAGVVRSANITADKTTGIGNWTKAQFINQFKQYADSAKARIDVKPHEFQSIMPWYKYADLKETDLAAIYAYVKTIKPIKNEVVKFSAK
jgi:mono/diheme cytochrome c family protein